MSRMHSADGHRIGRQATPPLSRRDNGSIGRATGMQGLGHSTAISSCGLPIGRYSVRRRTNDSKDMQSATATTAKTMGSSAPPSSADTISRDERIKTHLHLVRSVARAVRSRPLGRGVELEDLFAYGSKGLVEAASRFDGTRGIPFGAFARHRIRGAIVDGIRAQYWFGRRAPHHLRIHHAGEIDERQLCHDGRWNGRRMAQFPVEEDGTLQSLDALIRKLSDHERRLLNLCYGQGKRLTQAASAMGVSRSWASRLHARALATLRTGIQEQHPFPYRRRQSCGNEKHAFASVPTHRMTPANGNGAQ